ncbi:sporulation protein [Erythrobacter sp. YT30]|nr:sporulation protein [Erythrobacter sp. YT30]
MRSQRRLLSGVGAIAALLVAAPALADVKAGVDAWSAGDYTRAVAEWREPAAQGDVDAMFNLAQAYRLGRGVPTDIDKARDLYLQAAQRGHIKAADNYGLLLFQQGEQDKAMPLIEAAAGRGDPRAQYILGLAHFNADYAEKDWVRAYALMTLSQSAGLPQANKALAQMDQYIPVKERQAAQSLAVSLKSEADQRLATRLAAVDLGVVEPVDMRTPIVDPAPRAPHRTASAPPASTQASTAPQGLPPAPQPVPQYRLPTPQPNERAPYRDVAATPAPGALATTATGPWGLQLGAFGVSANADKLWSRLSSNPALAGTRKSLVPSGRVTRLLAVGFESQSAARRACAALKRQGQDCLVKKT